MYRTVIQIPSEYKDRLRLISDITGNSMAALMREAITTHVDQQVPRIKALIKKRAEEDLKKVEALSDIL